MRADRFVLFYRIHLLINGHCAWACQGRTVYLALWCLQLYILCQAAGMPMPHAIGYIHDDSQWSKQNLVQRKSTPHMVRCLVLSMCSIYLQSMKVVEIPPVSSHNS